MSAFRTCFHSDNRFHAGPCVRQVFRSLGSCKAVGKSRAAEWSTSCHHCTAFYRGSSETAAATRVWRFRRSMTHDELSHCPFCTCLQIGSSLLSIVKLDLMHHANAIMYITSPYPPCWFEVEWKAPFDHHCLLPSAGNKLKR